MRRSAVAVLWIVAVLGACLPPVQAEDAPITGMVIEDVRIPTRYGITLQGQIGFPANGGQRLPGPFPVALEYTPYCGSPDEDFARAGYVYAFVNWYGTCRSGGSTPSPADEELGASGYDAVEWLGTREWSTGRVGMTGLSGPGASQFYVAELQPPHLVTIAPAMAPNDPYEDFIFRGGMLSTTELPQILGVIFLLWWGNFIYRFSSWEEGWETVRNGWLLPGLSYVDAIEAAATDGSKSEIWQRMVVDLDRVEVPVLSIGNWDDFFLRGNVNGFTHTTSTHNALVVGWNGHNEPGPGFDRTAAVVRWFDHWLKGIDNGLLEGLATERVRYFLKGANEWRSAPDWPLPQTRPTDLYLSGEASGLIGTTGSLTTSPPESDGADTYVYQPTQGRHNGQIGFLFPLSRPNSPGNQNGLIYNDPTAPGDQRLESVDSLTYVTPPLAEDIEVTGPITVTLEAASTSADTDFVVKLIDVFPDSSTGFSGPHPGFWSLVTKGRLKGTHRDGHVSPEPIPTGEVVSYEVELLPTAHLFRTGHRLALQIASADASSTLPNPNPAVVDIFRSPDATTKVTLPVQHGQIP